MYHRRNNPWPAMADLFAALLVATFAGLVVIGVVGQNAADKSEEDSAELERLRGEVGELQESYVDLRETHRELQETHRDLEEAHEALARQRDALQSEFDRRGFDPPPCMLEEGKPRPLLEIVVQDETLTARRIDLGEYEELAEAIPALDELIEQGPVGDERFLDLARPVYRWGMNGENELGFKCVFYVEISISTPSGPRLAKAKTYVDEVFFTKNPSEVAGFIRNN